MAIFRVVVPVQLHEPAGPEDVQRVIDAVRGYYSDLERLDDDTNGAFELAIRLPADTELEAERLARGAMGSALFDTGFELRTATIHEVQIRPKR